jgi:hypothetical protein
MGDEMGEREALTGEPDHDAKHSPVNSEARDQGDAVADRIDQRQRH